MALGSKTAVVNANVYKVYFDSVSDANQYILATRKEAVYKAPQKRVATGAGPVYFTMLSDDRLLLEFAYTTSQLGTGTGDWNVMMQRNEDTGEVPENDLFLVAADVGSPQVTKTQIMKCKAEELRLYSGAEGETLAKLSLVIIDNDITIE